MFLSERKTNLSVLGVGRHRAKNFSQLIPNKLDILFGTLSKLGRAVVNMGGKQYQIKMSRYYPGTEVS